MPIDQDGNDDYGNTPDTMEAMVKGTGGGGGGGGGCFPAHTKIKTKNGNIEIAKLCEGDSVISYNDGSEFSERKILKIKKYQNNQLCKITFSDDSELTTTPIHSFNRNGAWVKANNLSQGDELLCFDSGKIVKKTISSITALIEKEPVFNLIVEGDYNFVADGVLAHSFTYFRRLRIFLYDLQNLFNSGDRTINSASTSIG